MPSPISDASYVHANSLVADALVVAPDVRRLRGPTCGGAAWGRETQVTFAFRL